MKNLLEETRKSLFDNKKSESDVLYCLICDKATINRFDVPHGEEVYFTWNDFVRIAQNRIYNSGYGHQEINPSIKIVGDNWWLERAEYDGSEWWKYKEMPVRPNTYCPDPKYI